MGSNPTSTATDLQERQPWQLTGARLVLSLSHLSVSVASRVRSRRPAQPQVFCLVTEAPDAPEQKHARRRGVHPAVQGWPGPSATGRMPANLESASHRVIEKFWRTRAERPPICAGPGDGQGCPVSRPNGCPVGAAPR